MKKMQVIFRISDAQKTEIDRLKEDEKLKDNKLSDSEVIERVLGSSKEQLIAANFANICQGADYIEEPTVKKSVQRSLEVLQCLQVQ